MIESEVQVKPLKKGKKNVIFISLIIFSFLMLTASAQLLNMILKQDTIYKGIYINQLNVSGMTKNEIAAKLNSEFQEKIKSLVLVLQTDRITEATDFISLNVAYEIDIAADNAYALGRTGSIFNKLYDIFNASTKGIRLSMPLTYDKKKLDAFINTFYDKTLIEIKEPDIYIQAEKVTLRSGHHGESINKEAVGKQLTEMINEGRGGTVKVEIERNYPSSFNSDELFVQINTKPKNAVFKINEGTASIEPHVVGMKIEKAKLEEIITELQKNEDTEKVLPVEIIQPEITTEMANTMVFKDKLASMSTHFSTGNTNDKNRGENIKIAVSKINGKILLPDDIFSFNEIVGPRTAEGGYLMAHTYSAGKVIDGIGGGICQVSSTLYGAVLKSDLEVLVRRNHMFTVGYVPYGQDATVSYGTQDFKFKNTTKWPIKIEAGVTKNNNVFFNFIGTNEDPEKKVIITQQIIKKIPFTIKYIDDPTLLEGTTKVRQEGKQGYIVDTFKTVKSNDKVISEVKLHTSKYSPLVEEVLKGTKKAAPGKTSKPTPTPAPKSGTESGDPTAPPVDDADNPPAE